MQSAAEIARAQEAQARQIYYSIPAVVGVSGAPGIGKTTDFLYAFPRGLFIAAEGALKPAVSVVGWVPPKTVFATTLAEVQKAVKAAIPKGSSPYTAVVLDDFGAAVRATEVELTPRFPDGRALYKELGKVVGETVAMFRELGCHVALSTHLKDPKMAKGEDSGNPGGADLPGQLQTRVPSLSDVWLKMMADPMRNPHPASYYCGLGPFAGSGTRDRHNVCGDKNPPNIGEILRAAGFAIPRAPGCEWHEAVVEQVAQAVLANEAARNQIFHQLVTELQTASTPRWQVQWIIRDALDRAEIRKNRAVRYANAFSFLGVQI